MRRAVALELPWKFSTLSGVIVLCVALSLFSMLRSIRSVAFDNRQRQMTVACLSGLVRRRRHRSLADLNVIQTVTFRLPSATQVRLVFDRSDPRIVMVIGFRKRSAAIEFARQLWAAPQRARGGSGPSGKQAQEPPLGVWIV